MYIMFNSLCAAASLKLRTKPKNNKQKYSFMIYVSSFNTNGVDNFRYTQSRRNENQR